MKRIVLELDGRRLPVWAAVRGEELWVHVDGQTLRLDRGEGGGRSSGRRKSHRSHPGKILAPMPGKITKVLVQVGDRVRAGQALVVMEAMKMEYTLSADIDGRVEVLTAQVGAQVGLQVALVQLRGSE